MRNSPGRNRQAARREIRDTKSVKPNGVSIDRGIKRKGRKIRGMSDCAWHHPTVKATYRKNNHLMPSRSFAYEMALDRPVFNLSPVPGLELDQKLGISTWQCCRSGTEPCASPSKRSQNARTF